MPAIDGNLLSVQLGVLAVEFESLVAIATDEPYRVPDVLARVLRQGFSLGLVDENHDASSRHAALRCCVGFLSSAGFPADPDSDVRRGNLWEVTAGGGCRGEG